MEIFVVLKYINFVRCCYHNSFKLAEGQTDAFIVDIVDAVGTTNLG